MPRDSQGLYTLPTPGNPVIPDTLITAEWANTTMPDIGQALTGSLPRNGSAPMVGPLTLESPPPVQPRHATSKAYVDSFMAYATGMPLGAVFPMASAVVPPSGYLLCDGSAVSRATYADLFAAIGSIYGAGDGVNTFNVPDLRDWFVRGKAPSRAVGSQQLDTFAAHNHGVTDPTHSHAITQTDHNHLQDAHTHTASQVAHSHTVTAVLAVATAEGNAGGLRVGANQVLNTSSVAPAITVNDATAINQAASANVTVNPAATSISTQNTGGTETTPRNIAMNYWIKAVNDSAGAAPFTGITSSDDQMISIDFTNPVVPELDIHSNVAYGILKLDANGKVPAAQIGTGIQNLIGTWDAGPGIVPPTLGRINGDTYIIGGQGNLDVYDPITLVATPELCVVGNELCYIDVAGQPVGWYRLNDLINALDVIITPTGALVATNAQDAIAELEAEKLALAGGTMTGDLTFFGNGRRIIGDMSNPIVANRLFFQTVLLNGNTSLAAIPNGTGITGQVQSYSSSDPDNASRITFAAIAGNYAQIASQKTGVGVHLPMAFYTGDAIQVEVPVVSGANRWVTLSGSNGGNPVIGSGGGGTSIEFSTGSITVSTGNPNGVSIFGNTTGNACGISAFGSDTNVSLNIVAQAAGTINFNSQGAAQVVVLGTAGANRYITLTGSNGGNPAIGTSAGTLDITPTTVRIATGNPDFLQVYGAAGVVNLQAVGSTTDITLQLIARNAGGISFATQSGGAGQVAITHTAGANRYITLTGSNGGNPTIGTSAGALAIGAPLVGNGYLFANAPNAVPIGGGVGIGVFVTASGIGLYVGSGVPTVAASDGSIYLRSDPTAGNALYSRIAGAWVANA